MAAKADLTYYDRNGKPVGVGGSLYLPNYLDWIPIEAKVFWFLERGYGDPRATHALLISQGEQRLVTITEPMRDMKHSELLEKEHGLEDRVNEYCSLQGISRTPRNQ